MSEVLIDFKKFESNGMIDSAELIKVAQKINKRLGNKLRRQKETILYVEKGRVRLPGDFHLLTMAMLCYDYTFTSKVHAGDQRAITTINEIVSADSFKPLALPLIPQILLTTEGEALVIVQTTQFETRKYKHFGQLHVKHGKSLHPDCHNPRTHALDQGYIENHFLYTNFDEGKVYISYLGDMEDEDGNLIVLDHPMVNDYYEYALKRRIIENLILNGETIPDKFMQIVEARYKESKVEGESIVNMPDFAEMDTAHNVNRKAMYNKYYRIFQ